MSLDRRSVIQGAGLLAGAVVGATTLEQEVAQAQTQAPAAVKPATFAPKPLPFDPQRIKGLSEKLLVSHYENNYKGAVARLNLITEQLASLDYAKAPGFQINGLKREELVATNSMTIHEVYFANLGDESRPGPALAEAIARDFGSHERWAAEFSAMGKALGGGSGWVLLTYAARDKRLLNQWASDHTTMLGAGQPVLVLDMFEHAYHIDYGAKTAAYVDAFMQAIRWQNADMLYEKASKA
jgi:superoxide dismutase, Fe-Mn family